MHWKTRFGISLCTGVAAVSSILLCGMTTADRIPTESSAPQSSAKSASDVNTEYCLRNYNGWIGVYQGDDLLYCSEILVDTLPASDQTMLETGIQTESWDKLLLLLEDFGS